MRAAAPNYASAGDVSARIAELIRPPRRIRPSEAAAKWLRNEKGAWSPDVAPELVEPLDLLSGRRYQGIIFVGPQRVGKTFGLVHAGVTYIATCAPGDTLILQSSQDVARDFSRLEVDRVLAASPALAERLSPNRRDDNTYDKFFRSGMVLKLGWPALSQVSGKTLKYVFLTDYDRPVNRDDVGGSGPLWDLALKRIATFMSRGRCIAESSPGEEYDDPRWMPRTPHEAPPCAGILELYNRGTRARWQWPCLHCGEYWEPKPGLEAFALPEFERLCELVEREDISTLAARFGRVVCPHCGATTEYENRRTMRARGRWVHEGETIGPDGETKGPRRETPIASFWLSGVSAPFQRWDQLVYSYLQSVLTYVRTGDEGPLRTTTLSDQGAPYLPRAAAKRRRAEDFQKRLEALERNVVPPWVRFLTAVVDVQRNRFVCQVHGWGERLQSVIVARFMIMQSARLEDRGPAIVDPSAYVEDWELLREEVLEKAYPVEGSALSLKPLLVGCDSGGEEGVTARAYEFYRSLRERGLNNRFRLVKGTGNLNAPRTQETWPDTRGRKDRSAARGDVPVWILNTTVLKDGVAGDLAREVPGPGYVHLSNWLPADYFEELTAEVRKSTGWVQLPHRANEAFDLHYYARALCIMLGAESIDWSQPPAWALPVDQNPLAVDAAGRAVHEGPATGRRRVRSRGVSRS